MAPLVVYICEYLSISVSSLTEIVTEMTVRHVTGMISLVFFYFD